MLNGLALPRGKPGFESQLCGIRSKAGSLRACFWWAMTIRRSREGLRQVVVEATASRTVGLWFRGGPSLACFLFIENWDSGGFCGHKSGLLGRHATWLDAGCLGKLLPQLGAHGMNLDRIFLLGREFLVPAAGWHGHAARLSSH